MKEVIWVGPLVETKDVGNYSGISPAANEWQMSFLKALECNDINIEMFTYIPERAWPFGKFFIKYPKDAKLLKMCVIGINYLNIPFIRDLFLAIKFCFNFVKSPKKVIFTFNPIRRHLIFVRLISMIYPIKWISIIADDFAIGNPSLSIFLSQDYYFRYSGSKLFFEGGIYTRKTISSIPNRNIIYAGTISKWTGIVEFVYLMDQISLEELDLELHIYGVGSTIEIQEILSRNSRIKFFGFVEDDILEKACSECIGFVNPRPLTVVNGDNNFPSKLLFYLGFKKPIISTITKNIPNYYYDLLIPYEDKKSLQFALNSIKSNATDEAYLSRLQSFVESNSWDAKVKNLLFDMGNEGII